MLRRVALVRTDASEELSASFIRFPSSPILVTLLKEALRSTETSVLTTPTRRNIPEDAILHSHRRENLKSYIIARHRSNVTSLQSQYGSPDYDTATEREREREANLSFGSQPQSHNLPVS
jgi:hypothetical protein